MTRDQINRKIREKFNELDQLVKAELQAEAEYQKAKKLFAKAEAKLRAIDDRRDKLNKEYWELEDQLLRMDEQ